MSKTPVKSGISRKRYSDLLGIDFSATSTKIVRLKKNKNELSLAGIDMLPPIDFGSEAAKVEVPRNMLTHYACLTYSSPESIIRMVNTQIDGEELIIPEAKLREIMNVEEKFRVSSILIKEGKGKHDSSFLSAAMPEDDIRFMLDMFPAGPPAPISVELASLSFLPAFMNARSLEIADKAVCLLDAGEQVSHFIFLNKGVVGLVGKLSFGANTIRQKLAADLGVDDELAATILTDRSINISASVRGIMEPYLKQLTISMDFIERHQGCKVSTVYLSGGLSLLPSWSTEVEQMLNAKVLHWSPLENIQYSGDVVSKDMEAQATRFAAAIGAVIGGLEES